MCALLSLFSTSTDANLEIPGSRSKAGNKMFNLSKEDDFRKYVARKREVLHQGSQDPTSSYSHPSPAPSSHPLRQALKIGAPEGAEVRVRVNVLFILSRWLIIRSVSSKPFIAKRVSEKTVKVPAIKASHRKFAFYPFLFVSTCLHAMQSNHCLISSDYGNTTRAWRCDPVCIHVMLLSIYPR